MRDQRAGLVVRRPDPPVDHPALHGIRTWHAFSAGSYYDPDNISFGPVIGCDEHLVEPGAGFDWHSHRGVVIVSWVLAGTLRHEDDRGQERLIEPGGLLVQSTGDGIRHRETNPSGVEPLRFVQTTLLLVLERSVDRLIPPARVGEVTVDVLDGAGRHSPGDSVREEGKFTAVSSDARLVIGW